MKNIIKCRQINLAMKTFLVVLMVIQLFIVVPIQVYAVENGEIFTTATHTYYLNPDTNQTDDYGTKNAAIGEGMCRSVINDTALIEKTNNATFLTIRVELISNIQSLVFAVQKTPGDPSSYQEVSYDIMQENMIDDTIDCRFSIPKEGAYIKCTAYVIPMSRNVCFYFNVDSTLTPVGEDDTDFVISASSDATQTEKDANEIETETIVESSEATTLTTITTIQEQTSSESVNELTVTTEESQSVFTTTTMSQDTTLEEITSNSTLTENTKTERVEKIETASLKTEQSMQSNKSVLIVSLSVAAILIGGFLWKKRKG